MKLGEHHDRRGPKLLYEHRKRRGLTQAAAAEELEFKSDGFFSRIENGELPSLELALKIQRWSAGEVPAAELRPDLAHLIPTGPQPADAAAA